MYSEIERKLKEEGIAQFSIGMFNGIEIARTAPANAIDTKLCWYFLANIVKSLMQALWEWCLDTLTLQLVIWPARVLWFLLMNSLQRKQKLSLNNMTPFGSKLWCQLVNQDFLMTRTLLGPLSLSETWWYLWLCLMEILLKNIQYYI